MSHYQEYLPAGQLTKWFCNSGAVVTNAASSFDLFKDLRRL